MSFTNQMKKEFSCLVVDSVIAYFTADVPVVAPVLAAAAHHGIDQKFSSDDQPDTFIRRYLAEHAAELSESDVYLIEAAAEICLKKWDLSLHGRPADKTAAVLVSCYFSDYPPCNAAADEVLRKNLTGVLEAALPVFIEKAQSDPLLASKWRACVNQRLDALDGDVARLKEKTANLQVPNQPGTADVAGHYQKQWKKFCFLDRDISNGKRLCDIYQVPDCRAYNHQADTLSLYSCLKNHFQNQEFPLLVLLGHPGSGKSTAITWLLNQPELTATRKVRVYRFSDFEGIDWNSPVNNLPDKLLYAAGLQVADLAHSILILDGLDEISMGT